MIVYARYTRMLCTCSTHLLELKSNTFRCELTPKECEKKYKVQSLSEQTKRGGRERERESESEKERARERESESEKEKESESEKERESEGESLFVRSRIRSFERER